MATSSAKIDDCEVCGVNKAKYTCPKCEVRTCCLQCVNIHKKELNCDGIRDKTKFKPLKSFTDLDVLSDYRFLEEVGRSVDHLKRDPTRRHTSQNVLAVRLSKLRSAAFARKVKFQLLPQSFTRHKENTTFLNWSSNELYWRIEWIFPQAEDIKWVTPRALETTRLSSLVDDVLDPVDSLKDKSDSDELNLRINLNDRLQFYQAAGLHGIKILLKAEKVAKSNFKFYELDVALTLKENLENKIIIEFPTLYVALKDHCDIYEIIDSDHEDSSNIKHETSKQNVSRKRRRTNREFNKQQNKNSTVNYFFNSDFSESDDEKASNDVLGNKHSSHFNLPDYNELVKMEH